MRPLSTPKPQAEKLGLPQISKSQLDIRSISLEDIPARYMNPGELEVLCALVRSVKAERVVEFGCNIGRTAKVILREVRGIQSYVGVDVNQGYSFACDVQKHEVPQHPGIMAADDNRFKLLLSDRGTLDLEASDLGPADVVFIDGDHSYETVRHDSFLAQKILRSNGMIIWHDYHVLETVDVRRVLDEFYTIDRLDITHIQGTWLAFYRQHLAS